MPGRTSGADTAAGCGQVTIILTRDCNCACRDCPVRRTPSSMSRAVLMKTAARLAANNKNIRKVKLFGGEPLLRFPAVKQCVAEFLRLGFGGTFEIGTNGLLLRGEKLDYFKRRPGIQVNINSSVSVERRFVTLPNLVWNLNFGPANIPDAFKKLELILSLARRPPRINVLPAYYTVWRPRQLGALRGAVARVRRMAEAGLCELENRFRCGAVPLFNDGVTIDVDGVSYFSNLVLAAGDEKVRRLLRCGCGGGAKTPEPRALLREIFGTKIAASTIAADRVLSEALEA